MKSFVHPDHKRSASLEPDCVDCGSSPCDFDFSFSWITNDTASLSNSLLEGALGNTGDEDNSDIGSKIWPLLVNWNWITRRVESVRLNASGDTRRHISFDFSIPPQSAAAWTPLGQNTPSEQLVVPLTFLNKGTIVNLDLRDASGTSLSNLSSRENGWVMLRALAWKAEELNLYEEAGIWLEDTLFDNELCLDSQLIEDNNPDADLTQTARILIQAALFDLVHSTSNRQYGHKVCAHSEAKGISLEEIRESYFDEHLMKLLYSVDKAPKRIHCDGQSQPIRFLDNFLSYYLFEKADEIHSSSLEEMTEGSYSVAEELQQFVAMIGCICSSYLFATLMPSSSSETQRIDRTIVKFSCDTEFTRTPRTKKSAFFKWFEHYVLGQVDIPIRYSSWSAASTHFEIQAPESTFINKKVRVVVDEESVSDKYSHLGFRAAGGRVQITPHRPLPQPLTALVVGLSPATSWNGILAAAWALVVSLLCGGTQFFVKDFGLTLEQHLAIQTVSLAVIFALFFTISKHPLAQECWKPIRVTIVMSLVLSTIPPCLLNIVGVQRATSRDSNFVIRHYEAIIQVCIALAVVVLVFAIIQAVVCRVRRPKLKEDNKVSTLVRTGAVGLKNVLAVTEAGVFSTNGLNRISDRHPDLTPIRT